MNLDTALTGAVYAADLSGSPAGVYSFSLVATGQVSASKSLTAWFDGSIIYHDPAAYGPAAALNGLDLSVTANQAIVTGATSVEVGLFDSDTATTPIASGECQPSMPYVQFPGLQPGTTYYVRQRNVDANGAKTDWSIAFPVTTPAA